MYRSNANVRKSTYAAVFCAAATILVYPATAQPPAQGPRPASTNPNYIPVLLITGAVKDTVNKSLDNTNAELATSDSYRARLTTSEPLTWSPSMFSTRDLDKPNQFYAQTSYVFSYTVSDIKAKIAGVWVPYPFSRTITQSIDIRTTCEGWHTGRGTITNTAIVQPPYLEGDHSFTESVIGFILVNFIPQYVDGQVRQAMKSPGFSTATSTGLACSTLGIATQAHGGWDAIEFDVYPVVRTTPLTPTITAKVLQVTRLPLHGRSGLPVYNAVETPTLDFWAGYSTIPIALPPMSEGQVFVPQGRTSVVTGVPAADRLLVLIGALTYEVEPAADSGWATFGKATNYGNGTQKIVINKSWFEPPITKGGKPVKWTGPAYEVIVQVTAPIQQTSTH